MKPVEETNNSNSLLWYLFSSVFVPLTVPWLIYKLFMRLKNNRKHSSLYGKVSYLKNL